MKPELAGMEVETPRKRCSECRHPIEELCHGPSFGCITDDYSAMHNAAVQAHISAINAKAAAALAAKSQELARMREALKQLSQAVDEFSVELLTHKAIFISPELADAANKAATALSEGSIPQEGKNG